MKKLFFSICIGLIFVGCSSDADQVLSESMPTLSNVEQNASAILVKGNSGVGKTANGGSTKGTTNTNTSSSYAEDYDNTMVP